MKENQAFEQDLASIHKLMERSVKFISLSGMSGILSGIYALIGSYAAWRTLQFPQSFFARHEFSESDAALLPDIFLIALLVLAASLVTGWWLTFRKAKRMGLTLWDPTAKRLFINLSIPLITGGLFITISALGGYGGLLAAECLVFYGLALLNAGTNLFDEVRYLGYSEIVLGLIAAAMPGYGLILWALGFGVLHIIYGAALYRKYDR